MEETTLPRSTPHPPSIVNLNAEPPKVQPSSPMVVDDLLTDSAPLEDVPTISPAKLETETSVQGCLPESDPSPSSQPVVDEPIGTTIRLIGGSRLSGSDDALPFTSVAEDAPNPTELQSRQGSTHEKNNSSSSLAQKSTSTAENRNGESSSTDGILESR